VITLDFPSFYPVLTYGDNRKLRREVYEAFTTRASDRGPDSGRWDNSQLMHDILSRRHEQGPAPGLQQLRGSSASPPRWPIRSRRSSTFSNGLRIRRSPRRNRSWRRYRTLPGNRAVPTRCRPGILATTVKSCASTGSIYPRGCPALVPHGQRDFRALQGGGKAVRGPYYGGREHSHLA